MGGGEVVGALEGVLTCQAYIAGRRFAQEIINDSYASGLIAELVLLVAKLMYEDKAVRFRGIGRGRLLCKSTCHQELIFEHFSTNIHEKIPYTIIPSSI